MRYTRCHTCGGTLKLNEKDNCYICDYCNIPTTISDLKDERIIQLKERASRLFLSCDFDGAAALCQSIASELPNDAETYWMLALCTYGIQYVDDPLTKKKIPTCHRTLYSSILNNEDYLNALDCGDFLTKSSYEESAKRIDEIQRGILNIVSKESPYDVFICYKETDENGSRTKESDIAKDLYYKLNQEGYRAFYAPITLQEKAGMEYEPFIFAALSSAKIMFVIGFSKEHYESVWVKNEWSRFLARKVKNPRLLLVSCYNSFVMDANELPEQLSKTQARDLANASTNDLVADVKKWLPKKTQTTEEKTNVNVANIMGGNAASLLKRGYIYLEDGEFKEAMDCFNKSLDLDPEMSRAYWGLILSKYKCKNNDELVRLGKPFRELNEYKKAARFADDSETEEYNAVLDGIDRKIKKTVESLKEIRKNNIRSAGIEAKLKASETRINELEKSYVSLLSQLDDVEVQIRNCVRICKETLGPQRGKLKSIANEAGKMLGTAMNKSMIDDTERQNMLSSVEYNSNEIKTVLADSQKIKNGSDCFVQLRTLLKKQGELFDSLDSVSDKLCEQTEDLDRLCSKMKKIDSLFAPAISRAMQGDYSLSSHLLN